MTMHLEPPPGEDGVELQGEAAARAITAALQKRIPHAQPVRISPVDLEVSVDGPWVSIAWKFSRHRSFTVRLSKHWAHMLKRMLIEALGS